MFARYGTPRRRALTVRGGLHENRAGAYDARAINEKPTYIAAPPSYNVKCSDSTLTLLYTSIIAYIFLLKFIIASRVPRI